MPDAATVTRGTAGERLGSLEEIVANTLAGDRRVDSGIREAAKKLIEAHSDQVISQESGREQLASKHRQREVENAIDVAEQPRVPRCAAKREGILVMNLSAQYTASPHIVLGRRTSAYIAPRQILERFRFQRPDDPHLSY